MPKPLPGALELIKATWRDFVKTWETTVRYSSWVILAGMLQMLYLFLPDGQELGLWFWVGSVGYVAGLVLMFWIVIPLYQVTLALDAGNKVTEKTTEKAWNLFWPYLLVGLLTGLAVLGGLVLLIIPGIYVGVRLGFTQLSLFDKDKHGRAALADSWALTKDRFWAILWREIAGGIVFGLLVLAVSLLAYLIVGLIAGGAKMTTVMADSGSIAAGLMVLISQIIQAAFLPLAFFYQVKIYRALRQAA